MTEKEIERESGDKVLIIRHIRCSQNIMMNTDMQKNGNDKDTYSVKIFLTFSSILFPSRLFRHLIYPTGSKKKKE